MWMAGSNLRPRLSPGVPLSGIVEPELPRDTDPPVKRVGRALPDSSWEVDALHSTPLTRERSMRLD
jgi:hypothetical protein